MNTKKITALALAALMAAGTTSTAFAMKADDALDFVDATVYEDNDGVLEKDDDGIAPGDTVYFRLDEDQKADDKDKKRLNVYADWKVGGSHIESIDIVYKKGNFQSNSNQQSTGFEYELDSTSNTLGAEKVFVAGPKMNNATAPETIAALKKAIKEEQLQKAADAECKKVDGHVFGTKYYASAVVNTVLETDLTWTAGIGGSDQNVKPVTPGCGYGVYEGSSASTELNTTTFYKEIQGVTYYIDTTVVSDADKLVAALDNAGVEAKKVDKDNAVYADTSDAVKKYDEVKELLIATVNGYKGTPAEQFVAKDGYTYWVEVKTKKSDTTKELDVAGTLSIGTSKNKAQDEKNDNKQAVVFTLSNRNKDHYNPEIDDEATINADENGAVKFSDDAEEVTLYFGANEDAWFTFNAKGQGALNFGYTLKFNKEIADLFPKANIDFISWNAEPATNRTGDLYITADEDTFLYEVTEDGIKEVKGAKYDEDEGAWHIRTRKLTSYAVSDIELDTTVKVEGKDEASSNSSTSSKPNGDKHNPDTGR